MTCGIGNAMSLLCLIWIGVVIWFVVFSFLTLLRLDKLVKLLEKKQ